jgi:plasmid stabilization system protein ParE
MTRLVLRPAARDDLEEAAGWYEAQRWGLGSDFLGRVDAAMESIMREPSLALEVGNGVRRALIRRFPYGIFFLQEEGMIVVLAVLHHRRDQRVWRQRR